MDVAEYYRVLTAKQLSIVNQCIADGNVFPKHISSHNNLMDFDKMRRAIGSGPELQVFEQACNEYQYSLSAAITGNYRHAFASLRLAFELFLGTIYFSAHHLRLRLWLIGHEDLHWGTVTDIDKGVFSHNFLKAFFPDLGPFRTQFAGMASTTYRESSEFVHGNPNTHGISHPDLVYDPVKLSLFYDKVDTVKLCTVYAFTVRYTREFDRNSLALVEHLLLDSLGHLSEVQALFEVEPHD